MLEITEEKQKFTDFDLDPRLLRGVSDAGFSACTPIQALALPIALDGRDLSGQAQTGTGKTAAFLLAMFNRLLSVDPSPSRQATQPRALILAPTRELAIQIYEDAIVLGRHCGLKMVLAYGGTGYEQQRNDLAAGVDVLIGTPGRVIDYFKQGVFDLKAIDVAVLDEADRMFDLGFIRDIRYLFNRMPPPQSRMNMLFSATLSQRVHELAYDHMHDVTVVRVESDKVTADQVSQCVYYPGNDEKIPLLMGILSRLSGSRVLVFVNTKHIAEQISAWLSINDIDNAVLSGDVPQKKRERLLDRFKTGGCHVLVATDVAARGLHIPDVSHVINFDLPQDSEDYVHRIGRTARAGASGEAISFVCEKYAYSLPGIEQFIGHEIAVKAIDQDELFVDAKRPLVSPPTRKLSGRRTNSAPASSRPGARANASRATAHGDRGDRGESRQRFDRFNDTPTLVKRPTPVYRRKEPEEPVVG